jgi:hypothetical protein
MLDFKRELMSQGAKLLRHLRIPAPVQLPGSGLPQKKPGNHYENKVYYVTKLQQNYARAALRVSQGRTEKAWSDTSKC